MKILSKNNTRRAMWIAGGTVATMFVLNTLANRTRIGSQVQRFISRGL